MNLLILFIILNIANVIIQTVKSIMTIKCGKFLAALANAVAFGLYTFVLIYMTADGINIWAKAIIVAICNFIGVYVVKALETKMEKERMWKVEIAIPADNNPFDIHRQLEQCGIPNNFNTLGNYHIYNCYCMRKRNTETCWAIARKYNGKCSAYEAKAFM